ncbi:MAG: DUF3883 domain-containing protein [Pyrinomonadaceae bacterium]|nr:DUF3883 domain-containing protein [Pyrinomonadaceae bacterium]
MKLSYEFLDQLKTVEYDLYKFRKVRDYTNIGCLLAFFIQLFLILIVAFIINQSNHLGLIINIAFGFFFGFFHPFSYIPLGILMLSISFLFNYFQSKTSGYKQHEISKVKFPPIEAQVKNQLTNYIDTGFERIIVEMNKRLFHYESVLELNKILRANDLFIQDARKTLRHFGVIESKFDLYQEKYNKIINNPKAWYEEQLKVELDKRKLQESQRRIIEQAQKARQNTGNNENVVNELFPNGRLKRESSQASNNDEEKQFIDNGLNKGNGEKTSNQNLSTTQNNAEGEYNELRPFRLRPIQDDVETKSDLVEEAQFELPKEKKSRKRASAIKVSAEFWEKLAKKKTSIGKKGELLAMEYERRRLKKISGEEYLKYLEHSSLKVGDGLGYDITSIENEVKIYIEVKTTTRSFESNLFITQNELEVMKEIQEAYYLYRIFEFDETNNSGRLIIFRGEKEITSYFNFAPQSYILEPKRK